MSAMSLTTVAHREAGFLMMIGDHADLRRQLSLDYCIHSVNIRVRPVDNNNICDSVQVNLDAAELSTATVTFA